jgi:uncharacterized FlaG/YvyC family protein
LLSNNTEFLSRNEDGLSLSDGKIELIAEETKRFEEIHKSSIIANKHIIYVNNGINFRPHDEIYNEVISFINNTTV